MRTTLDLDDRLVREALRATRARTKTELVELGLRALVEAAARRRLASLRGVARDAKSPRRRRPGGRAA
ncbi:MAG TPA: type II toxin-antitoxin system VapB family antitoxin [Planctomycetota bacterium]|jgi:Arc/MetJ family transcription regulator|nr:type II toxin-antitoxin system VapB family antitoxin [Planctomycetota bacterium]